MHLQMHAQRYGDTPEQRDRPYFNQNCARADIEKDDTIRLEATNGTVTIFINDVQSLTLSLNKYDHTAIALVWGDADTSQKI